jgi:DNA-binding transcriptional ArsR family regulator
MARAPTTVDAFAAIAEPRRREILGALAGASRERDVTWIVDKLGWPQPQVSKHLGVLRKVGLVNVVRKGKRRMYSVNGRELRPVYEWVKTYERFWDDQLERIKQRAEQKARELREKKQRKES